MPEMLRRRWCRICNKGLAAGEVCDCRKKSSGWVGGDQGTRRKPAHDREPVTQSTTYRMPLPNQKGIHEILVAYFRTAEAGPWEFDTAADSDQFVLNFVRRIRGSESNTMQLVISLRPEPYIIETRLNFRLDATDGPTLAVLSTMITEDLRGLVPYLQRCLNMASVEIAAE